MSARWFAIALALLLLGLFAIAIAELAADDPPRARWLDWRHHEYWGLLLVCTPWVVAWCIGLLFMVDDTVQHTIQVDRPAYLSPIHRLYVTAARWLIRQRWCPKSLASFLAH